MRCSRRRPCRTSQVLVAHTVEGPLTHAGVQLIPVPLMHGAWPCLGWRIGDMAWLTDLSHIPDESLELLSGVRLLFLDCLRTLPYPSHLSVEKSFAWAQRIGAARTVLIHMTHELEFNALQALCPPQVEVGFDGMRFELN